MEEEFDNIQCWTREQAILVARAESLRDLEITDDAIRYVAFIPEFTDYCLCGYLPERGAWVKVVRLLAPLERLPGEEISDERIVALAQSGQLISAIRLYRAKHEVGLLEGKAGVEALLMRQTT